MGDRGNVKVDGVYLYTHDMGTSLPFVVKRALRKQWRWDDSAYLARIIFCEMIKGREQDEFGFGISTQPCDWNHPTIDVDCEANKVFIIEESFSEKKGQTLVAIPFRDFIEMQDTQLRELLQGVRY